jgi:very-short-patch-repair endonuclease
VVDHRIRDKSRLISPDQRIAALAEDQHGLVTAAQLRAAGVSSSSVSRRLQAGRLHSVHHGVYAVGHRAPNADARLHAAVLAVGGDAVLSHISAAGLWGLLRVELLDPSRPTDVITTRHLGRRRGIRVHRTPTLARRDTTRQSGIPVTTPARTLLDLAGVAPANWLGRAVREAEVLRLVDVSQLLAASASRRGAARLRELVSDGPAPTRSELEDRTLDLMRRHGLPRPLVNATVRAGGRAYEVDFLFQEHRVIVEADGERYHGTALARRADAARQAALEVAGYRVVRLTWQQVTREGAQTAARLRRVIPAAAPV